MSLLGPGRVGQGVTMDVLLSSGIAGRLIPERRYSDEELMSQGPGNRAPSLCGRTARSGVHR